MFKFYYKCQPIPTKDLHLLLDLDVKRQVIKSNSKHFYDDEVMLGLANLKNAAIVSNDNFKDDQFYDYQTKKHRFAELLKR